MTGVPEPAPDPTPSEPRACATSTGHRRRLAAHVLLRPRPRRRGDRRRHLRAGAVGARRRDGRRARRTRSTVGRPDADADGAGAIASPMADLPVGRGVRLAGARRARGGRPVRRRPRGRAAPPRRGAARLVAGRHPGRRARRGPGAAAPHLARPAGRRRDARRRSASPTGCCELDFEIPLAGGDVDPGVDVSLADVGALLDQHLAADDPLRPYAARLRSPGLGAQSLRGYLSGSIDVVLRVPAVPTASPRYLVVDYKTNWLGPADVPAHRGGVLPRPAGRGDAALRLPAPGTALRRGRAPLPALAPARLRPGPPPRRRPLPLRARHVRTRHARGRRPSGRGLLVAAAGRAGRPRCPTSWTVPDDAAQPRARGPARPAARPRRGRPAPHVQRGRRARRLRRARGPAAVRPRRARTSRWSRWPSRSWCAPSAAARSASTWPRSPRTTSTCRGRTRPGGRRRVAASPLVTSDTPVLRLLAQRRRPPALPRPLLARGGAGARRPRRPARRRPTAPDETWLAGALDRVFPDEGYDEQRAAARVALTHATTVLTGGPGTGKTTTVAALLALCAEQAELAGEPPLRIALAAPTGKAAARLQQAVEAEVAKLPAGDQARLAGVRAVTLHRLLGAAPRHVVPVPAPPRQPAAARRGRGRRDLDGVADDDGPPARGGPRRAAG